MFTLIAIIHVIICIALIFFILVQNPKGGALGVFGGGGSSSNQAFSSTGASDFLVTITKWCAIIFGMTCVGIAYINIKKGSSVILDTPAASSSTPSAPKSKK